MIRIKKLTPPQIAALREAFPACVQAGWLTTTASIATFHQIPGCGPWRRKNLIKLARGCVNTMVAEVLLKAERRPDLVEEVAA